jgi:hypothetical protein
LLGPLGGVAGDTQTFRAKYRNASAWFLFMFIFLDRGVASAFAGQAAACLSVVASTCITRFVGFASCVPIGE